MLIMTSIMGKASRDRREDGNGLGLAKVIEHRRHGRTYPTWPEEPSGWPGTKSATTAANLTLEQHRHWLDLTAMPPGPNHEISKVFGAQHVLLQQRP